MDDIQCNVGLGEDRIDLGLVADKHDVDTLACGGNGSANDLVRSAIAAHGIDCDARHGSAQLVGMTSRPL
jgi:hypothetical protein